MNKSETSQPITSEQVTHERCPCLEIMETVRQCLGFRPPFNSTSQTHELSFSRRSERSSMNVLIACRPNLRKGRRSR